MQHPSNDLLARSALSDQKHALTKDFPFSFSIFSQKRLRVAGAFPISSTFIKTPVSEYWDYKATVVPRLRMDARQEALNQLGEISIPLALLIPPPEHCLRCRTLAVPRPEQTNWGSVPGRSFRDIQ